ncbi:hypothetical protein ACVOMT_23515 (plasmid) [Sphingomonas panni]|uniref:hypothetical protein n=1 Tax=Sphingomonas hankookensis TaxID=563996 RepID=UPI003D3039FC
MACRDFDATPNRQTMRKRWAPHANDDAGVDIVRYGWNGKAATCSARLHTSTITE